MNIRRTIPALTLTAALALGPAALAQESGAQDTGMQDTATQETGAQATALLSAASETVPGLVELADAAEAQALASAVVALTPARLADALKGANQSLSGNGYQRLPGGLIIQWGRKAVGKISVDYLGTITFPIAFPNATFQVNATLYSYAGSSLDAAAAVTGHSLTGFGFTVQEWGGVVQNVDISYIAIGY